MTLRFSRPDRGKEDLLIRAYVHRLSYITDNVGLRSQRLEHGLAFEPIRKGINVEVGVNYGFVTVGLHATESKQEKALSRIRSKWLDILGELGTDITVRDEDLSQKAVALSRLSFGYNHAETTWPMQHYWICAMVMLYTHVFTNVLGGGRGQEDDDDA